MSGIDIKNGQVRHERVLSCLPLAHGKWSDHLTEYLEHRRDRINPGPEFLARVDEICGAIEIQGLERAHSERTSQHVGAHAQRQEFTARVKFRKLFTNEFGDRNLTVMEDTDGNILKYWNTINLAEPTDENPKAKRPAEKGELVSFSATVAEHGEYKGVKQTQIQRVTKAKLAK